MARIIYKDGCDGQRRLGSIEGIEIDLLNGQKALIYPKYREEALLYLKDRDRWLDAGIRKLYQNTKQMILTDIKAVRLRAPGQVYY